MHDGCRCSCENKADTLCVIQYKAIAVEHPE